MSTEADRARWKRLRVEAAAGDEDARLRVRLKDVAGEINRARKSGKRGRLEMLIEERDDLRMALGLDSVGSNTGGAGVHGSVIETRVTREMPTLPGPWGAMVQQLQA